MDVSVLIPTHGRPEIVKQCLEHLTSQNTSVTFEVLVGVDGGELQPGLLGLPESLRGEVIDYPKLGPIAVRRRLLERACGELIISLNDDSLAQPALIENHWRLHADRSPRVISGPSPWVPVETRDLFDELVERTDLIFFRPRHPEASEAYEIGFRDCYGLNMSFPRLAAIEAGGFPDLRNTYGYEDPELAFRLQQRGLSLWHAPDCVVEHHHRYRPESVMRREYLLGRTAHAMARVSPAFTTEIFGRNILDERELMYCREIIQRERRDAARIERSFVAHAGLPSNAASEPVLHLLAEHWVLLKRYLWRWGMLDAAEGREASWRPLSSM